ncbi:TenA family protein [Bifidobacterium vansinderenii]|uniref:Aminopyrimidine aminohydrolase n=1 Tax=Bifidobacterium vansinderenii TaxID=1984871 RepID=A0A229VW07_9BIFI|nr:TenA family protein [Bifidobacterium vansinderenii]OXM99808.1 TENA/THI-4 family protein [Bifidobacterium vansinderenii]
MSESTKHVPEAAASVSGEWAFLGAEAGSIADQLYMSAADDWNKAINSRFVNELLDDTLPDHVLVSYLIQDFKFFNQGIMEHAIALAPREETKEMLRKQSQFFADEEAPYFTNFLKVYHVTDEQYENAPQTPANKEYCDYLSEIVNGTWEELITALCCMEWLYLAWAKRTVDAGIVQQVPAHKGWVDLHEGELFRAWTGRLIALVNEYASVDGSEADVFRRIVHLERRFFEDAYDLA